MTEQDTLREQIKWAREFWQTKPLGETGRNWVGEICDAAEQSLTFRRLPLPEELDEKALFAMFDATKSNMTKCGAMREAYRALYEHLTKPKRVWRVSAGGINIVHVHETEDAALERAKELLRNGEVAVITSTKESA